MLAHECATLNAADRQDLARRVRWVSDEEGDGAGYEITSFQPGGRERLIEVKTTNCWERIPFDISRNEIEVADARRDTWRLRAYGISRETRAFEFRPPLDAHAALSPTGFMASFA